MRDHGRGIDKRSLRNAWDEVTRRPRYGGLAPDCPITNQPCLCPDADRADCEWQAKHHPDQP